MKKFFSILMCLLLLALLPFPADAASDLTCVVDEANLLTQAELSSLEQKAQNLGTQCEADIVIVTVDSLDGQSAQSYAEDYFDSKGYGSGADHSGILFLLALSEREWYISTSGDMVDTITGYDIDSIGEEMTPNLSSGNYAQALTQYLSLLETVLKVEKSQPDSGSHPVYLPETQKNPAHPPEKNQPNILLSLGIGAAVAAVVVGIMCLSMNTKRPQQSAGAYMKAGSFQLKAHQDLFLYSNVSKTRKQQPTNTGGHLVHTSSGGTRHGGGGGKF